MIQAASAADATDDARHSSATGASVETDKGNGAEVLSGAVIADP
jgi:hypothetical protein